VRAMATARQQRRGWTFIVLTTGALLLATACGAAAGERPVAGLALWRYHPTL
jgi:hypothetical protein